MPSQPTLADISVNGKTVPVIYAPAKTGNIFVLDRRNGELVVPAPEKPVPQGAAKGDHVTPTQPFSDLSFRPKKDLSGADMGAPPCSINWCAALCSTRCAMKAFSPRRRNRARWCSRATSGCLNGAVSLSIRIARSPLPTRWRCRLCRS